MKTSCWMTSVVKLSFIDDTKTRPVILASFLFVCATFFAACSSDSDQQRTQWRLQGPTMGTQYHITVVSEPGAEFSADQGSIQKAIDQRLADFNQVMSTYIPNSELMRLNAIQVGDTTAVSKPLFDVLMLSEQIARKTDGVFDVTVGPLVNAWGFGPKAEPERVPTAEQLAELLQQVDYQSVQLDPVKQTVTRQKPTFIDLSAIAKGYGADVIAGQLESEFGISNYLVEIGGEMRLQGVNGKGQPWRIGIETPSLLQSQAQQAVAISNAGMATSGDYRNYYERDGVRYSHTIDPNTGHPIRHTLASVTVVMPTAAEADAWATALNVMGLPEAMTLAKAQGIPAYFIAREEGGFTTSATESFAQFVVSISD